MTRRNGGRNPFARRAVNDDGERYDVVIVGSGIAGVLAAVPLVRAGLRVLMLERGDWVPQDPRNAELDGTIELTPYHAPDQSYLIRDDARLRELQTCSCVGGQAVFFGGAVLRYREEDFALDPEIAAASGARWPFSYSEIEPWYHQTEQLLDVAGPAEPEPTAPPRSGPYPQSLPPLTPVAGRMARAMRDLGFTPSRLPLAINYRRGVTACSECRTCDSYACAESQRAVSAAHAIRTPVRSPRRTIRPRACYPSCCAKGWSCGRTRLQRALSTCEVECTA